MKTLKTAFLLTGLTLLLLFLGAAFGGERGMTLALVFAVLMNGTAYFFSDKIALMSSGAQPISKEQAPRLYEVMERLAAKSNLPSERKSPSIGGAFFWLTVTLFDPAACTISTVVFEERLLFAT